MHVCTCSSLVLFIFFFCFVIFCLLFLVLSVFSSQAMIILSFKIWRDCATRLTSSWLIGSLLNPSAGKSPKTPNRSKKARKHRHLMIGWSWYGTIRLAVKGCTMAKASLNSKWNWVFILRIRGTNYSVLMGLDSPGEHMSDQVEVIVLNGRCIV